MNITFSHCGELVGSVAELREIVPDFTGPGFELPLQYVAFVEKKNELDFGKDLVSADIFP